MVMQSYAQRLFGEVHGLVEAAVVQMGGEATVEEIQALTSLSAIDAHHAIADMTRAKMCCIDDGTVRLVAVPSVLKVFIDQFTPK